MIDILQEQVSLNYHINPYNAEIFLYKLWRPKGFFNLKSSQMS